jgi:hypothetical protein
MKYYIIPFKKKFILEPDARGMAGYSCIMGRKAQRMYNSVPNTKVAKTDRTLFSLLCVCNTWVADRTHMNIS